MVANEAVSPISISPVEDRRKHAPYTDDFVDLDLIEPQLELRDFDDKRSHWIPIPQEVERSRPPYNLDTTGTSSAFRWGPVLGLACLLFVFLSIPAAAVVLSVSDGQLVMRWNIKPNVYLAVISGIGNKLLAFAAFQGAVVTWWLRAMDGSTLRQLHLDWAAGPGNNLWYALSGYRHSGLLAVSTLCAAIVFADGVLLQSASTVIQASVNEQVVLHVTLAPQIPTDFTGSIINDSAVFDYVAFNPGFQSVLRDFVVQAAIPAPITGCTGTCRATVTAAAMSLVTCVSEPPVEINLPRLNSSEVAVPYMCDEDSKSCPLLSIEPRPYFMSQELIRVVIGLTHFNDTTNTGQFVLKRCIFASATAEYAVEVHNNSTVTVFDFGEPVVQTIANNTRWLPAPGYSNSTLGGIGSLAWISMRTSLNVGSDRTYDDVNPFTATLIGNLAGYFNGSEFPRWIDPVDKIKALLNEIAFRTSVQAASLMDQETLLENIDEDLRVEYDAEGTRIDQMPTYQTRWKYFVFAATLDLICVVLVALLYRDYWKLGRSMSISPLETAKAFDVPLLRYLPSNMNGKQLAQVAGEVRVRYGAFESDELDGEHASRRLIFHDPSRVYRPMNTFTFGP
ncbi:hypothetical protein CLAFUW4_11573 [Fulvia fulva]|uniref:Transmembrane protein n=1 Tax=Passalora fulva TaxID=5499 RepID=A0A9Q8PBS9_PASFU|nr:uncharacterized protein CLAFUR5_10616 [Fulvia fulva]KAK4619366.1 hypothetical protein CLAFUR4_11578 [Fulvia fulva]KAK4620871.1 hypothetical protein CLAFUR0_11587 [Fulvia fulva]UJO19546.1 hypothetical protein CLAFUR5_10616 [Fulvia fulva]WPV17608.1 hypothetical protein CLAFUW4_11573 [Fulvia fulva]WPV32064.1 hypothetical protein CLAFUW7_11577 [Fulvia fulva]